MIKKTTHIIIAAILILATTGFTISRHYCMGSLVSVSINHTSKDCCGNGHCNKCHNESQVFKVSADFLTSLSHASEASVFHVLFTSADVAFDLLNSNNSSIFQITPLIKWKPTCSDRSALLQIFRC